MPYIKHETTNVLLNDVSIFADTKSDYIDDYREISKLKKEYKELCRRNGDRYCEGDFIVKGEVIGEVFGRAVQFNDKDCTISIQYGVGGEFRDIPQEEITQ